LLIGDSSCGRAPPGFAVRAERVLPAVLGGGAGRVLGG